MPTPDSMATSKPTRAALLSLWIAAMAALSAHPALEASSPASRLKTLTTEPSPMVEAMEQLMQGHVGEAILTDLRTGERWTAGGARVNEPFNAASTFKLLTSYYGLTRGLFGAQDALVCRPFSYGKKKIRCWRSWGHGGISLTEALADSCNGFFYTIGLMPQASATELEQLARDVGYVPANTRTTKPELFGHGDGWYVSPLAQAKLLGAIATAGTGLPGGSEVPPVFTDLEALRAIRRGMRQTLVDGSAKHADVPGYPMAGKTGTLGKQGWFLTYGPYESPEVTCVVHLDHEWGRKAASLSQAIVKAYLNFRTLPPEQFSTSLKRIKRVRPQFMPRSRGD